MIELDPALPAGAAASPSASARRGALIARGCFHVPMASGTVSTSLPILSPRGLGHKTLVKSTSCTRQEETGAVQTGGLSLAWCRWHLGILPHSNPTGQIPPLRLTLEQAPGPYT